MNYQIQLIDHTASEILKRESDYLDHTSAFLSLLKYPIKIFDIEFEECCAGRRLILPYLYRLVTDISYLNFEIIRKLGFDSVVLNWHDGDEFEVLDKALDYCKNFVFDMHIAILNASDTKNINYAQYRKIIEKYDVQSIIYCDENGMLNPFSTFDMVNEFKNSVNCETEFRANDNIGLATANTLSAIKCGIIKIHTSVGGIDSFKSTAMEEALLINNYFNEFAVKCDTSTLAVDCENILKSLAHPVSLNKAVIGENIFAHESGIHVDGITKNSSVYEAFNPEEVGLQRKVIIGKHSGRASIKAKLSEYGLEINDNDVPYFLALAKKIAINQKRSLSEHQFIELYNNYNSGFMLSNDKCIVNDRIAT